MKLYLRYFASRLDSKLNISKMRNAKSVGHSMEMFTYNLVRVLLYLALITASFFACRSLAAVGLAEILPTLSYSLSNMICFALTILSMSTILSCNEENEFMLSVPLSDFAYVGDMLLAIYGRILAVSFVLCFPAILTYNQFAPEKMHAGYAILGFFLTGMPLGGIAALAGVFVALCLAESPKKNQIQSLISILCVAIVSVFVVTLFGKIGPFLANAAADPTTAETITAIVVKNSKFVGFYNRAIMGHDPVFTAVLLASSIIWFVGFSLPITLGYRLMITSFACPVAYKEYEWQDQEATGLGRAIFRKEMKQLILSKNYLVHVAFALVVGLVASISLCASKQLNLGDYLSVFQVIAVNCAVLAAANTTYCAYSIEGKHDWILQSAGVENGKSMGVKVFINLMFTLPYALISGILLGVDMGGHVLLLVLIPMVYAVINAWLGAVVDLHLGRRDAKEELQAMHQGWSYLLGYLPGIILPIVLCLFL